jgi:hypothetical protein
MEEVTHRETTITDRAMKEVTVTSLKDLQQLVRRAGDEEGVKVAIGAELQRLCDASGMCKILKKMTEDKHWIVSRGDKLEPHVPIVRAINNASRRVVHLTDLLGAHIILNMSKHHIKIRKAAKKLKEAAADLTQTNLEPVKLLGEALNDDAKQVLKGRKSHSQLLFDLGIARKYCAEVYNQKTPLDQPI